MSVETAEAITIRCPCGYVKNVTEARYHESTTVEESAKKRAAGHSGQCSHDYDEISFNER